MRWTRDQYLGLMTFGDFPRPMLIEPFGPLKMLADEWRAQGVNEDEINMTAFDFDYVEFVDVGVHTGAFGLPPEKIIEDSETILIKVDGLGRRLVLDKRTATLPLPQNYPVQTMEDWLRIKPYYTWCEDRIDPRAVERAQAGRERGALVIAQVPGAYDTLRSLMGEEGLAYACVDDPEMVHDIMATLRDTAMRGLDLVSQQVTIDQLCVHEDMAGKSGPLFGPKQIRTFAVPYLRPVWDMLANRGTKIFDIDTDGNVNAIMDDLSACGLNHMHPMEPAAGMDIVQVRRQYGRAWTFNGGLDKFAVMQGPDAIDRELDYKLDPRLIREGGVAFGLDHRIPNGTPIEHYRYYVRSARERLGLPPLDGKRRGWGRMAI